MILIKFKRLVEEGNREAKEQMEQSIDIQDVTDRLGLAKFSVRGLELRVGEAVGRKKDL